MSNVVSISNLHKKFGDNHVLRGIDLAVSRGEVVCIIGPSGSGKSTLLRCVNMLEQPSDGTIVVLDQELTDIDCDIDRARTTIGMVFQSFNLFPHMTVLDNICVAQRKVLKRSKEESEAKARALLARVGLSEKEAAYPAQLSGGQQQRVAIARALAMDPSVMLFDEATSALDEVSQGHVSRNLESLAVTWIVIAHRLSTVRRANRILVLSRGEIVQSGTFDELVASEGPFRELVRRQLLEAPAAGWEGTP